MMMKAPCSVPPDAPVLCFSANAERLLPLGAAKLEHISYTLGVSERTHTAIRFAQPGDGLRFVLSAPQSGASLTLEIEELHDGTQDAFAYTLSADGQVFAARTEEPLVRAARNVFFTLPPLPAGRESTVEMHFLGGAAVGIRRVFVYAGLDDAAGRLRLDEPLLVNEYMAEYPERVARLTEKYTPHAHSRMGAVFHLPYLNMDRARMRAAVAADLSAARAAGLPVQWMFSHWWAGAGSGPDGRGGYFADLEYGQLCVDQQTGREHPTTPNMWSSTAWPTMHHDYAEDVYGKKIAWAAAEVARALAHDAPEPYGEPAFIMEWGSGYWSHTDRDGGDMSDTVVAAAARDGVRLDPRAGFGPAEKDWFFTDNARYHDGQTVHYRRALGHTPIRVTPQGATLPDTQYSNALYTHTVQAVLYPSFDDRHPAWVSGMGDRMWASSEMYAFTDPRHYEYGCANSRLSCANLEVTMLDAAGLARYLIEAYGYGMGFVTLFNPGENGEDAALAALDRAVDAPAEPAEPCCPVLLDADAQRDWRTGAPGELPLSLYGVGRTPDGRLVPERDGAVIEGRVTAKAGDTLTLSCEAMANDPQQLSPSVTGEDGTPCPLTFLGARELRDWFNKNRVWRFSCTVPQDGVYTVRLCPQGAQNTVRTLKVTRAWRTALPAPQVLTVRQQRVRHSLVQHRLSAERLLGEYRQGETDPQALAEVQALLAAADYAAAEARLSGLIAQQLPIAYAVREGGRLPGTPFTVTVDGAPDVQLTLTARVPGQTYRFTADAAVPLTVTFAADDGYRAETDGNTLILTADPAGKRTMCVPFSPQKRVLPDTADGIFRGMTEDGGLCLECQDPAVGEYAPYTVLPVAPDCAFTRRVEDGAPAAQPPQQNDALHLTIRDGAVTAVEAVAGLYQGTLSHFEPPSYHGARHNGLLHMADGRCFELSYGGDRTLLERDGECRRAVTFEPEQVQAMFCPGDRLQIAYSPYTFGGARLRAGRIRWL